MIHLKCDVTKKQYAVKKVAPLKNIPISAKWHADIYTPEGIISIYRTDNFIFYAKTLKK